MLICRNAEGVHGWKKVGNPWFRTKPLANSVCVLFANSVEKNNVIESHRKSFSQIYFGQSRSKTPLDGFIPT